MPDDLPEFDAPIFKQLARNDTGSAPGHQAGIVIPKDLESFFPLLPKASASSPTVEQRLKTILVVPGVGERIVDARYQHQTWGGTRSPERRLTDNLSFLRNEANVDDILIIERGLQDRSILRLTLIRRGTNSYNDIFGRIDGKRWGVLDKATPPVKDTQIIEAEERQTEKESNPLTLFDNVAAKTESRVQRIARSAAFQKKIVTIYERKCAVCGEGLIHPKRGIEIEAAHIVPRGVRGADDARNGLALCRTHHWGFDWGLFGVQKGMRIFVPTSVKAISQNKRLLDYEGKNISMPTDSSLSPAVEAFEWHMDNIVNV